MPDIYIVQYPLQLSLSIFILEHFCSFEEVRENLDYQFEQLLDLIFGVLGLNLKIFMSSHAVVKESQAVCKYLHLLESILFGQLVESSLAFRFLQDESEEF